MRTRLLLFTLLVMAACSLQAQVQVKGKVIESADGSPLIGATIIEKGVANGAFSDEEGNFEIKVSDNEAVLEVSYIGYLPMEIEVGNQRNITITMEEDVANLEEVVVVGYGTQKKKLITGAISKIKADDLEDMPLPRIEQALQGRSSGVRVTTNSGQPGEGATVRVRGTTTINGNDPLYVVDGVPVRGGIDYLAPEDIESIEVLKDAASASIYGTRAAAGVILVTTKKGAKDRFDINYSAYFGVQSPWKKLALLNATEYATLMNESSVASGGDLIFNDPASLGVGTDWQDAIFNYNAPIQNQQLSISAGSDRSQYYASFAYFDQTGIVADA